MPVLVDERAVIRLEGREMTEERGDVNAESASRGDFSSVSTRSGGENDLSCKVEVGRERRVDRREVGEVDI